MMRIAIIEDNPSDAELIRSFLERIQPELEEPVEICLWNDGIAFLSQYKCDIDMAFVDIDMPKIDGLSLTRQIRDMDENIVLVFVTNMWQCAINGYEVNAADFAVKPVKFADFRMKFYNALRFVVRSRDDDVLSVQCVDSEVRNIHISQIYYVESELHYLTFHTVRGDFKARGTMKSLEEKLADRFFRINYSYLVNLKYVEAISGSEVKVGSKTLFVSKSRKQQFVRRLTELAEGGKL